MQWLEVSWGNKGIRTFHGNVVSCAPYLKLQDPGMRSFAAERGVAGKNALHVCFSLVFW
jgi:hypothetical protein